MDFVNSVWCGKGRDSYLASDAGHASVNHSTVRLRDININFAGRLVLLALCRHITGQVNIQTATAPVAHRIMTN